MSLNKLHDYIDNPKDEKLPFRLLQEKCQKAIISLDHMEDKKA
jgi:hypothetical protein